MGSDRRDSCYGWIKSNKYLFVCNKCTVSAKNKQIWGSDIPTIHIHTKNWKIYKWIDSVELDFVLIMKCMPDQEGMFRFQKKWTRRNVVFLFYWPLPSIFRFPFLLFCLFHSLVQAGNNFCFLLAKKQKQSKFNFSLVSTLKVQSTNNKVKNV